MSRQRFKANTALHPSPHCRALVEAAACCTERSNLTGLHQECLRLAAAALLTPPLALRAARLTGFTIRVGSLSPTNTAHFTQSATCWYESGTAPLVQTYTCTPGPLSGRYVSVRIEGQTQYLHMYEVQVLGF